MRCRSHDCAWPRESLVLDCGVGERECTGDGLMDIMAGYSVCCNKAVG